MARTGLIGWAAGGLGLAALLVVAAAGVPRLLGPAPALEVGAAAAAEPRPTRPADGRLPIVAGPRGRPLVVLDPGHGGRDPGASAPGGPREKEVALGLARAIREALLLSGRARVALTRDDDRFLSLAERSRIAERLGAALLISVHLDSSAEPAANGATVYTLADVASDRAAARLARRENGADGTGGRDRGADAAVAPILLDLSLREAMERAARFAGLLRREAAPFAPFRADPHRFAAFRVLRSPDVPAVLLEAGYLTNAGDGARLLSPSGQERFALGVARAVDIHLARERGGGTAALASAQDHRSP